MFLPLICFIKTLHLVNIWRSRIVWSVDPVKLGKKSKTKLVKLVKATVSTALRTKWALQKFPCETQGEQLLYLVRQPGQWNARPDLHFNDAKPIRQISLEVEVEYQGLIKANKQSTVEIQAALTKSLRHRVKTFCIDGLATAANNSKQKLRRTRS